MDSPRGFFLRNMGSARNTPAGPRRPSVFVLTGLIVFGNLAYAQGFQPRYNFNQRLEPRNGTVIHGGGQSIGWSQPGGFPTMVTALDNNAKPAIAMDYAQLRSNWADNVNGWAGAYSGYGWYVVHQIGVALGGEGSGNYEQSVADGNEDSYIVALATAFKNYGRPIYIRIGYECNGSWNGYNATAYKAAFRRITDILRTQGADNVATVWCLDLNAGSSNWMDFYPGDDVVDWWSMDVWYSSNFAPSSAVRGFLDLAVQHQKPVMIGETTTRELNTANNSTWENWFVPFFNMIRTEPVIKAFCYINWNWTVTGWSAWGDSRIEINSYISNNYNTELHAALYLNGGTEAEFWAAVSGGTPSVNRPTISPNGGTFSGSVSVTLSTATAGATIYYTINGADPIASSTRYTGAFNLTASATVKAIGIKSGLDNSSIASAVFTVTAPIPQSPYPGPNPARLPGTVEAEDFDNGSEGTAYHDVDASNNGGAYRPAAGVDIKAATDNGTAGYAVGWVRAGEWLEYTVNVLQAGTCTVEVRTASQGTGGTFHIEFNGTDKTGAMTVPNTGTWDNGVWQTVTKTGVTLAGGQQVMRIAMDTDGASGFVGDFNTITIRNGGASPVAYQPGGKAEIRQDAWQALPNPVTVDAFRSMVRQRGIKVFCLDGTCLNTGRVKGDGIYFIGQEIKTARKIMVIR